jgi:hypothetical protein
MRTILAGALGVCLAGASTSARAADLGGLAPWTFLVGDWSVTERRYDFDGNLTHPYAGYSTFSRVMHGARLQELATVATESDSAVVLHLFVWNPRTSEVELTRTDSDHYAFWTLVGAASADRIEMRAKHPDPESKITRRVTYLRPDSKRVIRRLEFSQDQGDSWFVRNEVEYARE